jgi:hypothetical protein
MNSLKKIYYKKLNKSKVQSKGQISLGNYDYSSLGRKPMPFELDLNQCYILKAINTYETLNRIKNLVFCLDRLY